MTELAPDFWRATARYGFMERPDIPQLLQTDSGASAAPCSSMTSPTTSAMKRSCGPRMVTGYRRCEEKLYAAMARNATHISDFLRLPSDGVVEIGRQVAI